MFFTLKEKNELLIKSYHHCADMQFPARAITVNEQAIGLPDDSKIRNFWDWTTILVRSRHMYCFQVSQKSFVPHLHVDYTESYVDGDD